MILAISMPANLISTGQLGSTVRHSDEKGIIYEHFGVICPHLQWKYYILKMETVVLTKMLTHMKVRG